jgi:hypothetical protein
VAAVVNCKIPSQAERIVVAGALPHAPVTARTSVQEQRRAGPVVSEMDGDLTGTNDPGHDAECRWRAAVAHWRSHPALVRFFGRVHFLPTAAKHEARGTRERLHTVPGVLAVHNSHAITS